MLISKFNAPILNDNTIKDFEEKYNINLSDGYKKFLVKYNGGKTPKTNFKINNVSSDIIGFYGFGNKDVKYSFETIEKKYFFIEFLKDNMLPIGQNSFGDYIMISIGEKDIGGIYFFYHDEPKKYIKLTSNFELFISACKSKRVEHIRTLEERKKAMLKLGKEDKITSEKIAGWQAEIDEYANIQQEELIVDKQ